MVAVAVSNKMETCNVYFNKPSCWMKVCGDIQQLISWLNPSCKIVEIPQIDKYIARNNIKCSCLCFVLFLRWAAWRQSSQACQMTFRFWRGTESSSPSPQPSEPSLSPSSASLMSVSAHRSLFGYILINWLIFKMDHMISNIQYLYQNMLKAVQ